MNKARTIPMRLSVAVTLLAACQIAWAVPITLVPDGFIGGSLVFEGDLSGLGLTQIGSLTIQDDGTAVGGSAGIFSGFDLDAVFLDADGDLSTSGDWTFGSTFSFTAGTTRPTANSSFLPNAAHPGPTFGSLNATTIDFATATLNSLDALSVADVDVANGFLTLGDGGTLDVGFAPTVPVSGSLFLIIGEVGGQAGEGLGASIEVRPTQQVPEPYTLSLLAIGLACVGFARRRMRAHA